MAAPQPNPMGHSWSLPCLLRGGQAGLGQRQALLPCELEVTMSIPLPWIPQRIYIYIYKEGMYIRKYIAVPGVSPPSDPLTPGRTVVAPPGCGDEWAVQMSPLVCLGQAARTPPRSQPSSGWILSSCRVDDRNHGITVLGRAGPKGTCCNSVILQMRKLPARGPHRAGGTFPIPASAPVTEGRT